LDSYLVEWAHLLLRWAHLIVGIAWIGASFYFIWLDNHLQAVERSEDTERGVGGELWAVHGGGFYHAQKYRIAPPKLPPTLHWFKWEAYWTFITGFALLVLLYYFKAEVYLIDPQVMDLSKPAAIGIGIGSLVAGWVIYDLLCRSPLGKNDVAIGAIMFVLLSAAAWGLTQVFSGRGAFLHFGAILGTIMVANVAMVIMPGQRELVKAKAEGRLPEARYGEAGKLRSVHNTYFTLPALFAMIAPHFAMTFGSKWNWLILILMSVAGALIRVWFVMRHKGYSPSWPLAGAALILAGLIAMLAPRPDPSIAKPPAVEDVRRVVGQRCIACHSEKPTFQGFAEAPKGVMLDTPQRLRANSFAVHQQTVVTKAMPPGNLTEMTDDERALIDRWYRSGAR
jgi:uncharacterized membrane protein